MSNNKFYDGTKLLSMSDLNGKKPEIYMCTSNRSAGKTTYFNRLAVNQFKKKGEKFALLYRFNYELDDCADKFFKDIGNLFFEGDVLVSKRKASGIYHTLYLNEEECGYAISLNSADQLKRYSHLFSDVKRIIFDEFQSETNHYCDREVQKFISIHTSIARGDGSQIREVPVYMISNPVSIINPYYTSMNISDRLTSEVKFLRGDGFVLEQGYNESASVLQKTSGFNRAFKNNSYVSYSAECVYLNDSEAFIEKPQSNNSKYLATIRYMDNDYGVRQFDDLGIIYCDTKPDKTFPYKISVTTDDHNINYVMLKSNDLFISHLRYFFERGCFRFKNLECKDAILKFLSY